MDARYLIQTWGCILIYKHKSIMKTPNSHITRLLFIVVLMSSFSLTVSAKTIDTCLNVTSKTKVKQSELLKLAKNELAKYPSHKLVTKNCKSTIYIETFSFSDMNFVTLRTANEVPIRNQYKSTSDLVYQLEKGLKIVLGNDPVYLKENIAQYSEMQRALHSVNIQGIKLFRIELVESITRTGQGASFSPGLALGFTKGSRNLFIFSRLHGTFKVPGNSSNDVWLQFAAGIDGGLTYEFNHHKNTSFYVGAGLGAAYQRFEGYVDTKTDSVNELLLQAFARFGVRMFRMMDFDLDFFVMPYLPFMPASDADSKLLGKVNRKAYTPSVQMGLGVGF